MDAAALGTPTCSLLPAHLSDTPRELFLWGEQKCVFFPLITRLMQNCWGGGVSLCCTPSLGCGRGKAVLSGVQVTPSVAFVLACGRGECSTMGQREQWKQLRIVLWALRSGCFAFPASAHASFLCWSYAEKLRFMYCMRKKIQEKKRKNPNVPK